MTPTRARGATIHAVAPWAVAMAPSIWLLIPLVVFVHACDYDLLSPELAILYACILAVGVPAGWALARGPRWLRVLVLAGLFGYVVDAQLVFLHQLGWRLAWFLAASAAIAWFVDRHVRTLVAPVGAAMLVATIAMPGARQYTVAPARAASAKPPGTARQDLAPILHVILDAHEAIGAVQPDAGTGDKTVQLLKKMYLGHGLDLYANAFSRYHCTAESLSNLMNFTVSKRVLQYFAQPYAEGAPMRANAYFDAMHKAGYRIKVIQSNHMQFCTTADGRGADDCSTYRRVSLRTFDRYPLTTWQKTTFIYGNFEARSYMASKVRVAWNRLVGLGLPLPEWSVSPGDVGALSSMAMLERLSNEIPRLEPATLYFVHLILPHSPYGLDEDCHLNRLHPDYREILLFQDGSLSPEEARAKYSAYEGQVRCATHKLDGWFTELEATGTFQGAQVFVHGDHGSRVVEAGPDLFEPQSSGIEFLNMFGTLVAFKPAGRSGPGHVDERDAALDVVFRHIVESGEVPATGALVGDRKVVLCGGPWHPLKEGATIMDERVMPSFADGRPTAARP